MPDPTVPSHPSFEGRTEAVIVGIDGTGAQDNSQYRRDMAHSFVRRILWHTNIRPREYYRGPDWSGQGLLNTACSATRFILAHCRLDRQTRVFLTGYSRGGAGVIQVARFLQGARINVTAMVLFDAVERDLELPDCTTIPNNVGWVIHAHRDVERTHSRRSFGNCGLRATYPTKLKERTFVCTHGGMGGTPWRPSSEAGRNEYVDEGTESHFFQMSPMDPPTLVTYAQDRSRSPQIWAYVRPFLKYFSMIG